MMAEALPATGDVLPRDRLLAYEQNILEHTATINKTRATREGAIEWKYHQHLALMLTEIYLDHYFRDPEGMRQEINAVIAEHNTTDVEGDRVEPFPTEPFVDEEGKIDDADPRRQLSRLAFWCATGSGKTLLMHVNVLQFRWYHERARSAGKWPALAQVILVTPNEGLSEQHAREFAQSGLDAVEVGERGVDGLFADVTRHSIKILDIHKFRDAQGEKTVATEAFEGCNLVLVDEGHRGAGRGEDGKWMMRRDQLSKGGFCFEYSATLKEAVQGQDELRHRYARSILFDYAYRSFYRDGYGKDFMILNLEADDQDASEQERYLAAAVLLFYQQMRVWMDGGEQLRPFQIDRPLWVFVGHTVTGTAKTTDDKEVVSDVTAVLKFFSFFIKERARVVKIMKGLLTEGFTDSTGKDLLKGRLSYIDTSGDKESLARDLYAAVMRDVFRAPPDGGAMTVQIYRGAEGELALRVGDGEPFGVVNVGDAVGVAEACNKAGINKVEDDHGRGSLFAAINRDDSPINVLVGSRKFTEGWNSWRVSSIGLMRMGRSEGTQIIQLFGRGVRLRGYRMSLRRSTVLAEKPTSPKGLRLVETLQVFGVKASYMATFKDWIEGEVPEAKDRQVWDLPTIENLPKDRKLKTLRLQEEIEGEKVERGQAFKKLGPLVVLRPPDPLNPKDDWLKRTPVRLNWLPKIQGLAGENKKITKSVAEAGELPEQKFKPIHIALLDFDALLFGLESYKATHGLDRLHARRESIRGLFEHSDWYELLATASDMDATRYENRVQWQRMAQQMLNQYAARLYAFTRSSWEAPYIEIGEVGVEDLVAGYTIETTDAAGGDGIEQVAGLVEDLKAALRENRLAPWSHQDGRWKTVPFGGHVYQPLLHVGKGAIIRISPVALDQHESKFVEDLATWCGKNKGVDVFLLRNQAKTGLGFFQAANFFPDFLMWVRRDGVEHLSFVDPKGLTRFDPSDPKIRFAMQDIPKLQSIIDRKKGDLRLSAFIVSNTPFGQLEWSRTGGERMTPDEVKALGIVFQVDDATTYIAEMMGQMAGEQ